MHCYPTKRYSIHPAFSENHYEIYENILNYGIFEGFQRSNFFSTDLSADGVSIDGRSASSLFLAPQAALFYLLASASRLSALTINFIYFAALQIVSYSVVSKMTRDSLYGLMFVGLILMLDMPFFWAGGLIDFRLDFASACIYGIFIAMVIQSDVFLNVKWSICATALGICLVLVRYVTGIYLGWIFLGLLFYNLLQLVRNKNNDIIQNSKKRIRNSSE